MFTDTDATYLQKYLELCERYYNHEYTPTAKQELESLNLEYHGRLSKDIQRFEVFAVEETEAPWDDSNNY